MAASQEYQYAIYPSLKNKLVVVTGGAEGIGAAAVAAFCHQGSQVIILDISTTSAEALVSKLQAANLSPLPIFHHCDVTNLGRLKEIADDLINTYTHIDVLVNNAAFCAGEARVATPLVTPEIWQSTLDVNLRHIFFLTQYLVPAMKSGSSIVNMGSISWRIPATGLPVYTLAKAGIHGLTRTHAREFGERGIRVNSIMPGSIATEKQKKEVLTEEYLKETMDAQAIKRVLEPEEVARVIVFLGSADSSGVTGSSYGVDGGWVGDS